MTHSNSITLPELFCLTFQPDTFGIIYDKLPCNNTLVEFCFTVMPMYFSLVWFNWIYCIFGFILLIDLLILICSKSSKEEIINTSSDFVRFKIITIVTIAVFLADFRVYDSARLGKQMGQRGLKLMDVGAVLFAINAGFIYSICSRMRLLYAMTISAVLGLVRFGSIHFDRNVRYDMREFGQFMNFFFILAICTGFFLAGINYEWIGEILLIMHEILLRLFLEERILRTERSTFYSANIEGVSYIIPILGVMMIFYNTGKDYFGKREKKYLVRKYSIKIACYVIVYCGMGERSIFRRTHNMTFMLANVLLILGNGIVSECLCRIARKRLRLVYATSRSMLQKLLLSQVGIMVCKRWKWNKSRSNISIHVVNLMYLLILHVAIPRLLLLIRQRCIK